LLTTNIPGYWPTPVRGALSLESVGPVAMVALVLFAFVLIAAVLLFVWDRVARTRVTQLSSPRHLATCTADASPRLITDSMMVGGRHL